MVMGAPLPGRSRGRRKPGCSRESSCSTTTPLRQSVTRNEIPGRAPVRIFPPVRTLMRLLGQQYSYTVGPRNSWPPMKLRNDLPSLFLTFMVVYQKDTPYCILRWNKLPKIIRFPFVFQLGPANLQVYQCFFLSSLQ